MNTCPKCDASIAEFLPLGPGDCLVCQRCAVILIADEAARLVPATAGQIDALSPDRFAVIMETEGQVLQGIIGRLRPATVNNQHERELWLPQNG